MDNKSDYLYLIITDNIDANRQESNDKMKTCDSKLDNLASMMEKIMGQIQISNCSSETNWFNKGPGSYHFGAG